MDTCSVLGANFMQKAARIILGMINTTTCFTATFGNLLIILVIFHYKSLRRRSNYLIVCLALTDLTVGLVLQPIASAQIFAESIGKDCKVAYAVTYIGAMLCGASSWILTLISYDRYLHLVKLQNYNMYMTKRKLRFMVTFCWVYPICLGFLMFSDVTLDIYYALLVLSANFNVLVIVFCYWKSYKFIKEKAKIFPRNAGLTQASNNETDKIRHHWKLAKTFALIIGCYLLCWTPMVIFVVYLMIARKAKLSFGDFEPYLYTIYQMTLVMGYSNSSMNPVIYFWRNKELKAGMKQFVINTILRRQYLLKENVNVSVQSST
ncbi:octopamine receptor Oamb-like [Rhopilema esculentum]|uniref:octopamine receptor Oamb-like n=1 Tax=Rhopilema esculentum TaxID=499914 RepID=UPI0031DF01F2|eukprot:gene3437-1812_t